MNPTLQGARPGQAGAVVRRVVGAGFVFFLCKGLAWLAVLALGSASL